jgi:hemerythrin
VVRKVDHFIESGWPDQGAAVPEAFQERRQQRPFRILYTPLSGILRRFILRGEERPEVRSPDVRPVQVPAPEREKSIPWKCGVTRLDEQNEALFKAIRRYQAALKSGAGSGAMEEALAFLEGHAEGHFALEEAFMQHVHFPGLAEHQQGHRAFQHQIHAFRDRIANGDPSAGLELSQFLYAWMRVHVLKEDMVWSEHAKSGRRG